MAPKTINFCVFLLIASHAWASNTAAQGLLDPTLPPAFLRSDQSNKLAGQEPEPPSTITDLHLQALILGKQANYAVIDGVTLQVGATFKGWRIIRINNEGALLQGASGTQLLKIHPAISKTGRR
jgi:hypothetical protein